MSGLQVIAEPSVERYRDSDLALAAIADTLGAGWIMRGSVQEVGGQVRVNAQLIDPRAEATAWADQYRQKLTAENLFAIQGEITREIAGALQAELTPAETKQVGRRPTEDLEDFRSENIDNLFEDADGDLAYLGLSDYRLERTEEEWPRLTFASTKQHTSERA